MLKLRDADRRLHVGDLQIVAEMRIDIFVIIALGEIAQLPSEALVAAVVLSGSAIAIPAPVAERLHDLVEIAVIGEYGAALAHRDVMGG